MPGEGQSPAVEAEGRGSQPLSVADQLCDFGERLAFLGLCFSLAACTVGCHLPGLTLAMRSLQGRSEPSPLSMGMGGSGERSVLLDARVTPCTSAG